MITIEFLQREIEFYIDAARNTGEKKTQDAHLRKIAFLRQIRDYLRTCPKPEFIDQEIQRIEKLIDSIRSQYGIWLPPKEIMNSPESTKRNRFESETGISLLKKQLKTLRFIKNGKL